MHRALTEQRLEREGLPREEARRRSRRTLGNVTLAREDARAVWIPPSVDSVRQDVAFAVRALVRQPGFTVVAVGTLAAGIGLNTALFTVFNALALRPWPVHEPERIVTIFNMSPRDIRARGGGRPYGFSLDEVSYFESHARSAHGFIASRTRRRRQDAGRRRRARGVGERQLLQRAWGRDGPRSGISAARGSPRVAGACRRPEPWLLAASLRRQSRHRRTGGPIRGSVVHRRWYRLAGVHGDDRRAGGRVDAARHDSPAAARRSLGAQRAAAAEELLPGCIGTAGAGSDAPSRRRPS